MSRQDAGGFEVPRAQRSSINSRASSLPVGWHQPESD